MRSIAQSGSASGLGPGGREFKSLCSDQLINFVQVRYMPMWRNGRRNGLKIRWAFCPCQFESGHGYQIGTFYLCIVINISCNLICHLYDIFIQKLKELYYDTSNLQYITFHYFKNSSKIFYHLSTLYTI